jgi:hypothetical protein
MLAARKLAPVERLGNATLRPSPKGLRAPLGHKLSAKFNAADTLEFSPDRLNLEVDHRGVIIAARCG